MIASRPIQWHILGAGAIGGLWACELHAAGHSPSLIFKDESTLSRYRQKPGFTLERDGSNHCLPVAATCPAQIQVPLRYLLVTTKATQTLAALSGLKPWLDHGTTVVLMQNGLGIAEPLLEAHPDIQLLLASTTEGAYRPSPFHVIHAGRGKTLLGAHQPHATPQDLDGIAESLSTDALRVQTESNIEAVLWRKLAVNCAINPLTALHDCRNGELLNREEIRQQMEQVCDEFMTVSVAMNRENWVKDLKKTVLQVATDTAGNRSSMLQDISQGRPTEIDAINGYICQLARQLGVDVPLNRTLVGQIHDREQARHCR